jgi:hypothetical protein
MRCAVSRVKIIGWAALAVAVLGYLGMAVAVGLAAFGHIGRTEAVVGGVAAGVVGEVALWIAAGALGFTIFKRRKAILDRLLGRKAAGEDPAGA